MLENMNEITPLSMLSNRAMQLYQPEKQLYFSICASGVGLGVLNHSPLKALMSQLLNSAALIST
jgi:hypothetical protein